MNAALFHKLMAIRARRFDVPDCAMVLCSGMPQASIKYSSSAPWKASGRTSATSTTPKAATKTRSSSVTFVYKSYSNKVLKVSGFRVYIWVTPEASKIAWSGAPSVPQALFVTLGSTGRFPWGVPVNTAIDAVWDYSGAVYIGPVVSEGTASEEELNKEANWDVTGCIRYCMMEINCLSHSSDGTEWEYPFTVSGKPTNSTSIVITPSPVLTIGTYIKSDGTAFPGMTGVGGLLTDTAGATYGIPARFCVRDRRFPRPVDMSLKVSASNTTWKNNDTLDNYISSTGLSFECKLLPSYPDASDVLDEWLPYDGGATV